MSAEVMMISTSLHCAANRRICGMAMGRGNLNTYVAPFRPIQSEPCTMSFSPPPASHLHLYSPPP